MSAPGVEDTAFVAAAETPGKHIAKEHEGLDAERTFTEVALPEGVNPEDLTTLRRVSGKITWMAFTIAFCECCERFSYYGTTIIFTNFIQQPLPAGSTTGRIFSSNGQPGALGQGQRASTGLVTFNQFWSYLTPLAGGYVADTFLGRYKTIHVAIIIGLVGHVVLTASAAPSVIATPKTALGIFSLGLIIFGLGTGFFKSTVAVMVAEQQTDTKMRVETLKSGERVLIDPAITSSRLFLYFYACINIGSLSGQIGMVYAERRVGFWLAYMLPTVLFLMAPPVLLLCRKHYILYPPTGSVLATFLHMFARAMKGKWTLNLARLKREFSWDVVRPSHIPIAERPKWMHYDDAWVDEVRRGLKACKVFLFLPLYWLAYNQMTNNLTSQAAVMQLNGAPNDLIQNLNPVSILILIPVFDFVIYPGLRKIGFNFTPIKRMTAGFFFATGAMIAACVTQVYIYRLSPCGHEAATCVTEDGDPRPAPINVWIQAIPFVFIGISEIFTSITGLEYAFTKAPNNMRSLVMAINYFMTAIAAAIGQALVALSNDPLLVWNYGVIAVLAFIGGVLFWICFAKLDKDEDKWNNIETTAYAGRRPDVEQEYVHKHPPEKAQSSLEDHERKNSGPQTL